MKNLLICLCLFLSGACSNKNSPPAPTPSSAPESGDTSQTLSELSGVDTIAQPVSQVSERNAASPPAAANFPKVFTNGKLTFRIEPQEPGRSKPILKVEGSKPNEFSMEFPLEGEVQEAFLLDLNKDGFSELYLAVAGPDDRLVVQGFASYRDRSAGEIYVKDKDTRRQSNSDRVFVENDQLYRTFQVPGGSVQKLKYELKKGETSFILMPVVAVD